MDSCPAINDKTRRSQLLHILWVRMLHAASPVMFHDSHWPVHWQPSGLSSSFPVLSFAGVTQPCAFKHNICDYNSWLCTIISDLVSEYQPYTSNHPLDIPTWCPANISTLTRPKVNSSSSPKKTCSIFTFVFLLKIWLSNSHLSKSILN